MDTNYVINIQNNVDVIMMRTQVRNTARKIGMGMMDQASISLAASSLAHALGLGCTLAGNVTIASLDDAGRVGVQVVCINEPNTDSVDLTAKTLRDARWMVDELTVETLPAQVLKVTLVKWMS